MQKQVFIYILQGLFILIAFKLIILLVTIHILDQLFRPQPFDLLKNSVFSTRDYQYISKLDTTKNIFNLCKFDFLGKYFKSSKFVLDARNLLSDFRQYFLGYFSILVLILLDFSLLIDPATKISEAKPALPVSQINFKNNFPDCHLQPYFYSTFSKIYHLFYGILIFTIFNKIHKSSYTSKYSICYFLTFTCQYDVIPFLHQYVLYPLFTSQHDFHVERHSLGHNLYQLNKLNNFQRNPCSYNLPVLLPILIFNLNVLYPFFITFHNKLLYIYILVAPWQPAWGAVTHAILQPLVAAHSGVILFSTFVSTIFNSPILALNGSAMLMPSFTRLYKFWDRSTIQAQVDTNETNLISAKPDANGSTISDIKDLTQEKSNDDLDAMTPPRTLTSRDMNKLAVGDKASNAIYIKLLASILELNLFQMIQKGQFGPKVEDNSFFLLRSTTTQDYLIIIHIISIDNERVNFQVRGLEFTGTYCQQEELNALDSTEY